MNRREYRAGPRIAFEGEVMRSWDGRAGIVVQANALRYWILLDCPDVFRPTDQRIVEVDQSSPEWSYDPTLSETHPLKEADAKREAAREAASEAEWHRDEAGRLESEARRLKREAEAAEYAIGGRMDALVRKAQLQTAVELGR